MRAVRAIVSILPFLLLACTPTSEPTQTLEPTLVAIQREVFTPSCALGGCHTGQFPAALLALDPANSFADLHKPMENSDAEKYFGGRLVPGQPDSSYFYAKVAWHQDSLTSLFLGSTMPQRTERLAQYKIDAIRQWIKDGAKQ